MEILLAEDERVIRRSLTGLLEANGYDVCAAADGNEALRLYRERRPDLLLLDVMMPKRNGHGVCEVIRKTDVSTPILFLTALDSDADELRSLGVGGDLHIPKTVADEVLLARIAAAIRRHRREAQTGDFDFADWHVEPAKLSMSRGPVTERLNEREVEMLRWFVAHPDEVFSGDFILTHFWGADFDGSDSVLGITLFRLREKLASSAVRLKTIRGSGYAYRPR